MRFTSICLFVFLFVFDGFSQNSVFVFGQSNNTLKPFLSEIRNTAFKTETGFLIKLDGYYFVSDFTKRPFIESNLGVNVPFVSAYFPAQKIKIVSSGFVGNNVLVDLFGPPTAAVINTDYFMGVRTGLVKYIDKNNIRNIGFSAIPVFHESTHLGDEYSIHGYQKFPDFKRINITHESWELAFVLNDPDTVQANLLSLKAGIQGLWSLSDGYYIVDSLEVKGAEIPKSENNLEFFLQLNWQRTSGFMCSPKWKNVLSIEARNRTQFSYVIDVPEKRTWNYNVYFGWLYNNAKGLRKPGVFFRYYNGIIPYGQLRNTGGFHFFGLSLLYY